MKSAPGTWIIGLLVFVACIMPADAAEENETKPDSDAGADQEGPESTPDQDEPWIPLQHRIGDLKLDFGGRFVVECIKYSHANPRDSGVYFDTARLSFCGRYKDITFLVEPDLLGDDTRHNLREAWAAWDLHPSFRLRAGQIVVALGSEFATREDAMPFMGYGFTSYLDGRLDLGVQADGDLASGLFWYEATATAGKGFDIEGRRRQNEQYSLRLVNRPFALCDDDGWDLLNGLFWGVGYAFSPDHDDPIVLATPLESVVFVTPDIKGKSSNWLHWETGYAQGPFRVAYERVMGSVNDVRVGSGEEVDFDQLTSWAAYATLNLSGYEPEWDRGRWLSMGEAAHDEEPMGWGRYGRWELAARYSNADLDRGLFDYGFTTYDPSTQEVRTFSLNLNWLPVRKARLSLGWVKTIADHELRVFGDTNRDSSVVFQVALNY